MLTDDNYYKDEVALQGMPNELVGVRIPTGLLKSAEQLVKRERYGSIQELLREALREYIIIKELNALRGIAKNDSRVKDASKSELARIDQKRMDESMKRLNALRSASKEFEKLAGSAKNFKRATKKELQEDMRALEKLYGSAKNNSKVRMATKEELHKLARKHFSPNTNK